MTRSGMTLVEVLVGVMLLGMLATLGLSALGTVGRAGAAAAVDATALGRVQDLLRLRLLGAVPLVVEAPGGRLAILFEGGADRVAFAAELPARFGTPGLALVELRAEGDALRLHWRPVFGAATGEGAAGRALLDGTAGLRLRYFGAPRTTDAPAWREAWSAAAALPAAVEISVTFPDGDARRWPPLIVAPRLATAPDAERGS